ncbi:insulinase family protein [Aerococcaceae bacterium zg-BR22]|uniref:insulinase family protein n=1 Tax=Aerococcaceae bacterium zg-1292 TaxID=2774330 RepID=UPI00406477C5|nr:insulinase family protein [Aerococcaceae bacterium zg-BR22]
MVFKLIEEQSLEDIQSYGKLYEHEETGAQVLRLENDDPNKAFMIAFKTPPYNDNGIAHILEHSVLNGSKKYPSKEPFVELIKGSLNTFVNAMTFPDKTIYPVASTNQQDFENLMSVYLDAVFQPKLYEDGQVLQQEGWHYHLEKPEDELIYKGVVYNEMKGALASPEQQMFYEVMHYLYPDTLYSFESGGVPQAIPSLTQEAFVDFHKRYYHPSQSLTVLYGDLDDAAAFEALEEYFTGAGKGAEKVNLAIDVPYVADHHVERPYSIAEGDDATDKDFLALAWHTNVADDILEGFALGVMIDVLFGNNQAPVKKALLDAGFAGDIVAYHEPIGYFSMINIIAKYTQTEHLDLFKKIVEETLKQVVAEGVDQELVMASLNSFTFKQKEMVISESNPRGVLYAITALQTWLYDLNPFDSLAFTKYFDELRTRFESGYFEELVTNYLLENPHRVSIALKATPGLNDRLEAEQHAALQDYKASLSAEEVQSIVDTTQALIQRQTTPDSQEDLAKIPMLTREDLTADVEEYPLNVSQFLDDQTFYHAPQFTAGIDYLELLYRIDDFSSDELKWLSLLAQVINKLATKHYTSKELQTKIDLYTGGIGAAVQAFEKEEGISIYFTIRGKALEEMDEQLLDLMHEIAVNVQLDDVVEITNIVQRALSVFEQRMNYRADLLASQRALSQVSVASKLAELFSGLDQYYFLKEVLKQLKSDQAASVVEQLQALYQRLINKARLNAFYIGSQERKDKLVSMIEARFADLPVEAIGEKVVHQTGEKQKEAFIAAQDVNYVAAANTVPSFDFKGAYQVMTKILNFDYLWNNIRVQGGAYGAGHALRRNGNVTFASYRDPNLVNTLNVYQGVPQFIKNLEVNDEALLKYIIGTISDINQPLSAADKGHQAFVMHHVGLSTDNRRRFKEEVLETTVEALQQIASIYEQVLEQPAVAVIGNKAQIEAVKEQFDVIRELY